MFEGADSITISMKEVQPTRQRDQHLAVQLFSEVKSKSRKDKLRLISNITDTLFHDDPYYNYATVLDNEGQTFRLLIRKSKSISSTQDRGKQIYESFRDELEKDHFGEYVAIDTEDGKIVAIARTPLEVIKKAEKIESKSYFTRRIGQLPRLR